jgi:hypothetical protein
MPAIGDIIELTVDILDRKLSAGMQGTIVHCHNSEAYEVEFTNDAGETLDFLALKPEQFIVVWRAETQEWVPLVEQVTHLIANLPEESAKTVLDFVRFLSYRGKPRQTMEVRLD